MRIKSLRSVLLLLIATLTYIGGAKAENRFRHLNVKNGLAHTDVRCLDQDQSGLIWIGTYAGLQSYDSYKTKLYDYYSPDTNIRASHNRIQSLAINGPIMWVGTQSGLTCFDIEQDKYIQYSLAAGTIFSNRDNVIALKSCGNDMIWVKTKRGSFIGLFSREKQELNIIRWSNSAKDISNEVISVTHEGSRIWLATKSAIYEAKKSYGEIQLNEVLNKSQFTTKSYNPNIINLFSNGHNLYVRSASGCAKIPYHIDGSLLTNRLRYLSYQDITGHNRLFGTLVVDKKGTLWNTTQDGVLQIEEPFRNPKIKLHTHNPSDPNSISSNFISSLFIDSYENIWVGTWGQGVNIKSTSATPFTALTHNDNANQTIKGQFVKSIEDIGDGKVWIITQEGGLNLYDRVKGGVSFSTDFPSIDIPIKHFKLVKYSPNRDVLYIGMMQGLFAYYPATQRTRWIIGNNKSALIKRPADISHITFDNLGRLWVSTWSEGLICIDDSESNRHIVSQYSNSNTGEIILSSNLVTSTEYCAEHNELWVCTNNGIDRIALNEKGEATRKVYYRSNVKKENSLSNNFIATIRREQDSIYWVGTLGGGVNRVVINSFHNNDYTATTYTKADGLPSNDAELIEIDAQSNIWIGGYGITKIDQRNKQILRYDYSDGLHSNSFKIGASLKARDNYIYMGGQDGLSFFRSRDVKQQEERYSLIFTDLMVHNDFVRVTEYHNGEVTLPKGLNYIDKLCLHHDQNDFAISFSTVGTHLSNRIAYRYRLNGYEADWQILPVEINRAHYSNLEYGKYEFELQVSRDNGYNWDENLTRTLPIYIIPPWWLAPISQILYAVILTVLLIILVYRYLYELKMKQKILVSDVEKIKTEENHQLKLQFFMNISHELKTPLTIILSAIEQINVKASSAIKDSEYFDSISRNANKLLSLINELVDFRKHDIGVAENHFKYCDISKIVSQLAEEFTPWAHKKSLALYIDDKTPIKGAFDEEKMAKIFCNLMSNAIKYTDKGEVRVSIRRGNSSDITPKFKSVHTERGSERSFEAAIITIADSGIGITSGSIGKIYDRFFQVVSRTSVHLGSGIGLAVARSMVLSQGGNITVSSERTVGSEFIVCIPLRAKSKVTDPNSNNDLSTGFDINRYIEDRHIEYNYTDFDSIGGTEDIYRPSLLIVEDNIELINTLREYFEERYDVITAENGAIGLEMCCKHNPDLIVSDVMMPEMSGIEMCSSIRENLATAYIPIILLTAKSDVQHQIEGYESGADLYIPKPFSLKLLDLNIARLIAQKRRMMAAPIEEPAVEEDEPETREDIRKSKERLFIDKMNEYIYSNLSNPELSVSQLCNELCVGRTKLYSQVKDICGQSLGDYIRDIRLQEAARLLRSTDMNIIEIIYEVGFGSNSHFSKVFKARYGVTPTEYAKQNAEE